MDLHIRHGSTLTLMGLQNDRYMERSYLINIVQASATDLFIMKMVHFLKGKPGVQFRFAVHDEIVCNVSGHPSTYLFEAVWNEAGKDKIEECWPNILLDSRV